MHERKIKMNRPLVEDGTTFMEDGVVARWLCKRASSKTRDIYTSANFRGFRTFIFFLSHPSSDSAPPALSASGCFSIQVIAS
jgi:hypothetical protein